MGNKSSNLRPKSSSGATTSSEEKKHNSTDISKTPRCPPLTVDDAVDSDGYGHFVSTNVDSNRERGDIERQLPDIDTVGSDDANFYAKDSCSLNWFRSGKRDPFVEAPNYEEMSSTSSNVERKFPRPFHSCASLTQSKADGGEERTGNIIENVLYNDDDLLNRFMKRAKDKRPFSPISFFSDLSYTVEEELMADGDVPTEESDLRPKLIETNDEKYVVCRSFHVVTTAALPWMTGTAVNPLLRAAYLNKMNRKAVEDALLNVKPKIKSKPPKFSGGRRKLKPVEQPPRDIHQRGSVTLCVPWLVEESDRLTVYGNQFSFDCPGDQETYIRTWLRESAKLPLEATIETDGIKILFYEARYSVEFLSILPIGDLRESIGLEQKDADVCILEEPEHLNIILPTSCEPWTKSFKHVVGIMHTNYQAYASKAHLSGLAVSPLLSNFCSLLTRVHCHKIIKLSDTLQIYAAEKECINNVHGIRKDFLDEGIRRAYDNDNNSPNGVYFIGKLLWAKGLDRLIDLEDSYKKITGDYFEIDVYGSGPESDEINRAFLGRNGRGSFPSNSSFSKLIDEIPKSRHEFRKEPIPASFPGRVDHALLTKDYKTFINPSLTEVLCTTTAEALAMGKFVIIPSHPSNTFFEQFPNCLTYKRKDEFVEKLQFALANEPMPLSAEHTHTLTWEAATDRCIEASKITRREEHRRMRIGQKKIDEKSADTLKGALFNTFQRFVLKSIDMDYSSPEETTKSIVPVECE